MAANLAGNAYSKSLDEVRKLQKDFIKTYLHFLEFAIASPEDVKEAEVYKFEVGLGGTYQMLIKNTVGREKERYQEQYGIIKELNKVLMERLNKNKAKLIRLIEDLENSLKT